MRFSEEVGNNELSLEQQNIVESVSQDIIQEKGESRFTEVIDEQYLDNMISRYIEKGIELDPMVRRSLQRAVRKAIGLSLE